ncbi:MAG: hypothetical protein K2N07_06085 [Desulfovibrio sp.]|nr:hypothetical protein [Desulfovibrio sp.]
MATYQVSRASDNSWFEDDPICIEADSLAAAKRKAYALREDGMNICLADAKGTIMFVRRWLQCIDSRFNRFGRWESVAPAF